MAKKMLLDKLCEQLQAAVSFPEKLKIIDSLPQVAKFLSKRTLLRNYLEHAKSQDQYLLKILLILEQGRIFQGLESHPDPEKALNTLVEDLKEVDQFYAAIGGIAGYQRLFLRCLHFTEKSGRRFSKPPFVDIRQENAEVCALIGYGIAAMEKLAEVYPVGGAADRLHFYRQGRQNEALPAALLPFHGRSLLEGLIRDLQAREYLFYKIHHRQIMTPIFMMTSLEKNNHLQIIKLCEKAHWFGRSPDLFKFLPQPMVPVLTLSGDWVTSSPLVLKLKPGGHGAIWQVMQKNGILDWFKDCQKEVALIRQINNPIAGIDYGILAFLGIGYQREKLFGFASCPRQKNAAEGVNVLIEKTVEKGLQYSISNREYTTFTEKGGDDFYKQCPANTNILFVNIEKIDAIIQKNPFPGPVLNMKEIIKVDGKEVKTGRLELCMQNLADAISEVHPVRPSDGLLREMPSYLTYYHRLKTISVTKRPYQMGKPLQETAEGCYYDVLCNWRELLKRCGMRLPRLISAEKYIQEAPPLHLVLHPALGPLWTIIKQKIRGGRIAKNSELQLEIAELSLENLDLKGSLLIYCTHPMGHLNKQKQLIYSDNCGKCFFRNVSVRNFGIDQLAPNSYWENQIFRRQSMQITIEGNGEFFAEDLVFEGDWNIFVPNNTQIIAYQKGAHIELLSRKITKSTWSWNYHFNEVVNELTLTQKNPKLKGTRDFRRNCS